MGFPFYSSSSFEGCRNSKRTCQSCFSSSCSSSEWCFCSASNTFGRSCKCRQCTPWICTVSLLAISISTPAKSIYQTITFALTPLTPSVNITSIIVGKWDLMKSVRRIVQEFNLFPKRQILFLCFSLKDYSMGFDL